MWNFSRNCMKSFRKFHQILLKLNKILKIPWSFLKNWWCYFKIWLKFLWKTCYILFKIEWRSSKKFRKILIKLREIYFKILRNSPKNWVTFTWKLCEIFLKLSEIFFKVEWNFRKNCVKFSKELREITHWRRRSMLKPMTACTDTVSPDFYTLGRKMKQMYLFQR